MEGAPCNFTGSGQLPHFGIGWLKNRMVESNSNTLRDMMKADISLGILAFLIVGLNR
jgi:hypothetical protein